MSADKLEQFNQYFQINEPITAVLTPVEPQHVPADLTALEADIPALFKLANEVNTLEQSALRPIRNLGDTASELAHYLSLQSRKIDLILSHILMQEEQQESTQTCASYGGGGFTFVNESPLAVGQLLRCKLFLQHEAAAIYCYGEVISQQITESGVLHQVVFTLLQEQDQDLIVRASLHAQTRQLKKQKNAQ